MRRFIVGAALLALAAAPMSRARAAEPWSWADAIVYFALTDRFYDGDPTNDAQVDKAAKGTYHGGDWQGLIDKLDYLEGLGVNALWISPPNNNIDHFVTGAGFPDWAYHGYWAEDFETPEEHFGTMDKLKELVDKAHAKGIHVLLDIVVNHAGYDSGFYKQHPKWFHPNVDVNTAGLINGWLLGLPDLKTEDPEVADYMTKAWIAWIDKTGADGFRVDTVKHVEHAFWKGFRKSILEKHPGFFLLGEVYGAEPDASAEYLQGDEFDAVLDFSFAGSIMAFLQGRGRTKSFNHYLADVRYHVPKTGMVSQYLDDHDVKGWLYQVNGDKKLMKLAAVLQLTTEGLPNIYYGDEVGRPGGDWPDNRSDMLWGDAQDKDLLAHYTKLCHVRREHKSLSRGKHEGLAMDGDLYVFRRSLDDGSDKVVVAVNRGAAEAEVSLDLPGAAKLVALAGESGDIAVQAGKAAVKLPGQAFAIFQEQ
jgi:glycosidase